MVIETNSEKETLDFGRSLAEKAIPGQVYSLVGDLGVGKTVLTKGIAQGLGITEPVSSPTFTVRLLQSFRYMRRGVCPSIILMYIGLQIRKKWKRSDMKITFSEKGSALWNGRI